MTTLSTLVSALSPEARAQWEALVEADERYRAAMGDQSLIEAQMRALWTVSRERTCYHCYNEPPEDGEPPCWLCNGERTTETVARLAIDQVESERLRVESERVGARISQAEKAKQAPAKWLEERGLLDPLWRALWAKRHARCE